MITLSSPCTVFPVAPVTLSQLNYTLTDNGSQAAARINGFGKPLVLWSAASSPTYVAMGDYTQAEIDARVVELLGSDPAMVLQSLIPNRPLP